MRGVPCDAVVYIPLSGPGRGTHAMNTQICALSSLFVTAERASTGVSVHQCNDADTKLAALPLGSSLAILVEM